MPVALSSKPGVARPRASKPKVVRRRGRARNAIESDEEIQREARSDSDSASDSSVTSDDTELASEDVITNTDARILTPNTDNAAKDPSPFFAPSASWSEMVADETANGPAELPVIEFSDFDSRAISITKTKPKKPKKGSKKAQPPASSSLPSPPLSTQELADDEQEDKLPKTPIRRPSFPPRPFGQSARQAYQQRLDNDPSYVPTVGEFWGHDDRLMDKNLRSLSGWWRGRWQGRGRGFAMRGRGGFSSRPLRPGSDNQDTSPVEKNWTHDGFEELKKNEERKRVQQPGRASFRGRGGAVPQRGGGSAFSPARSRAGTALPEGRVWFAMKPQLMWTKQHDAFLYLDSHLRGRHGGQPAIRVRIPGSRGQVVRPPPRQRSQSIGTSIKPTTATSSVHGSDYADKAYVVRLPKSAGKDKLVPADVEEPPIDDLFTVRPRLVAAEPIPLPAPSNIRARSASTTNQGSFYPTPPDIQSPNLPLSTAQQQLEQLSIEPQNSDPVRQAQTEEAVLRNPPEQPEEQPRAPPPLQTNFTPSQAYGSPYTYSSTLSPGIAVNQLGVPYELATGRPVYLPAPPVYNPNGMVHPNNMPYQYMSPTHGPTFLDPATGVPVFSFPRPSSAIPIRAPTELNKPAPKNATATTTAHQRTSTLSTSAPVFEPLKDGPHVRFPSLSPAEPAYTAAEGSSDAESQQRQSNEIMYNPYQNPYYYPEAYGYNPYVDMQYGEMYGQDSQAPMGTVYF